VKPPEAKPAARPPEPSKAAAVATKTPPPKKPARRTDTLVGRTINNEFKLIRKIGEGGYGTVYEGKDLTLERQVAVKLMLREKTTSKEFVSKFLREARTAAQLSHPNIVKIHLVGFDKDLEQHFLAMEYVEGKTLSEIMRDEGVFSVERAVDVMIQAANGLGEAHKKNIIHRDIKPGNVMITPKGVVKVADFGLAKVYDPDDAASTIIGTPYFMPPEQFEGKVRDGRTDIYALGVTLYYMLTLKRPFDGKTPAEVLLNIMKKDPEHPKVHNPEITDSLWKIIQKMLCRNVDERYATCEELLRDLRIFQEAESAEEKVFCPKCGFGNPFSTEECMECGTSVLEPCPVCGTPDFVGAKFCGDCGANLAREREVATLVSEAESHVAAGRIEKAIETYQGAREISEKNTGVIEGLELAEKTLIERDEAVQNVRKLLDDGDAVAAHTAAEAAIERFPGHEPLGELVAKTRDAARDARVALAIEEARKHLEAGELFDAVAAARRALEIHPDSDDALALLSRSEKAQVEYSDAREKAAILEEDGLPEDAVESWRKVLALVPGDAAAEEAIPRLTGIVEEVEGHRRTGEEALDAKDFEGARAALEQATRILPGDPKTLAALDRLRDGEAAFQDALSSAMEHLIAGKYEESRALLTRLAEAFPGEPMIETATAQVDALLAAADALIERGRALLDSHRPEAASAFIRAAERISPLDGRAEQILGEVKAEKKAQMKVLARARELLGKSEYEQAVTELEALGGVASPHREVAELSKQASEKLRESRQQGRDAKKSSLRQSLDTARELLAAGRPEAALAACQKALRIDRSSAEARELKAEIDETIVKHDEAADSGDTGIFPLGEVEA